MLGGGKGGVGVICVSGVGKRTNRRRLGARNRSKKKEDGAEERARHCPVWGIGGSVFESGSSSTGA